MGMQKVAVAVLCSSLAVVSGLASLNCDSLIPAEGSNLVCSCVSDGIIEWLKESIIITACNTAGTCIDNPPEYSFNFNTEGSNYIYNITILSFNFNSCGNFGCRPYGTTTSTFVEIGITSELDNTTTPDATEPTGDGTVTVNTSCIYPSANKGIKKVQWYKMLNNVVKSTLSTNIQSNKISCGTSCGFKQQTQYTYTKPTDISNAEDVNLHVTFFTEDDRNLNWTSSNTYWIEKECECRCNCTLDGGKIAFTVIDYLLDVVYTIVVVWLTCECCAKVWKPEDVPKHAILGLSTLAVVLLDIGYTILLFLCENDDSEDCNSECKDECDCCSNTKEVALTVVAWLLNCCGYVMIIYYICKRAGCKCPQLCFPASPAGPAGKPPGSVKPAGGQKVDKTPGNKHFTRDGRDQGHAMNDVTKNGGKGRPQPLPPQASSREDSTSEVSRQDVTLDVEKRPLPDIGGGGMGKRGLSANFEDNGDMTPMDGRGGQRLQPLKPPQASIAENDEMEKKKRKKKKKRKTDDNDGTERD